MVEIVFLPSPHGGLPVLERLAFALDPTIGVVVIDEAFGVDLIPAFLAVGLDLLKAWWNESFFCLW